MTLRDISTWFADKWDSIKEGFHTAATQSFWDWPLWLSISVGIGVPIIVLWWFSALIREAHTGNLEPFGWVLAFGVLAFLSALTTYDLWVSMTLWNENDKNIGWLRIGYPIMTVFFGSYFIVCVVKRWRNRRKQQSD